MDDGILGRETESEFQIAIDFIRDHFNGVKPKKIDSIEDINKYLKGFKIQPSKIDCAMVDSAIMMVKTRCQSSVGDEFGVQETMIKWYNRTFRAYMHFVHKNSWCDRDFKTFLRKSENLPKFFKEKLSCESPRKLWYNVEGFLMFHTCNNAFGGCSKVTYLKCSRCRFIYYCSIKCQIEDWPRHKLICQDVRSKYMELEKSRAVIQSYSFKRASSKNEGSLLSFKVFVQEIERALFMAYFSVIENTNYFDDKMNNIFRTTNKDSWIKGLKSLQRKRYKKLKISRHKFESQMVSVFDKKMYFLNSNSFTNSLTITSEHLETLVKVKVLHKNVRFLLILQLQINVYFLIYLIV